MIKGPGLTLTQAAHTEDFVWQHGGIRVGRLAVPAAFKVENYDYREGIVTTLSYEDGSRLTLQSGGMYGLPLFKGAEYILISTQELLAKTVRAGRAANGTTCWREDNYRPKTAQVSITPPQGLGREGVHSNRKFIPDLSEDDFVLQVFRLVPADASQRGLCRVQAWGHYLPLALQIPHDATDQLHGLSLPAGRRFSCSFFLD